MPSETGEWIWQPNWETGVTEQLEFATDVLQSQTGFEQRRSLRIVPRRSISAGFLLYGKERQWFDNAMSRYSAARWWMLVFTDGQTLSAAVAEDAVRITCNTAHLDFTVDGQCVLYANPFTWELVTITGKDSTGLDVEAVAADWPVGTQLFPVRKMLLNEQPNLLRLSDNQTAFDATFYIDENCEWSATLPAETYRDHPVYADKPNEVQELTHTAQRLLLVLDNIAARPVRTDVANRQFNVRGHQVLLENTADIGNFKKLLYALRGRQVAVWVPTHADDFTLKHSADIGATTLHVDNAAYTRYAAHKPDIRIELVDGTAINRRITDSSEIDGNTEHLELDTPLPIAISPATVTRICFLMLMRLTSDTQTIKYITNSIAESQLTFVEVLDDEL